MPNSASSVLIAYVPVLHEGYLRLFQKYSKVDCMYVLDTSVLEQFDYIRKDLRQLSAEDAVRAITGLGIFKEVKVINLKALQYISDQIEIVLPSDDISEALRDMFFMNHHVKMYPIFLRWDRRNTSEPDKLDPDRTISVNQFDKEMIARTFDEAHKSADIYRRIGALVVQNGKMILAAYNKHLPSVHTPWIEGDARNTLKKGVGIEVTTVMHAEASLIAEAAKRGLPLDGTYLYVSDFPCPLCAKYVALSGIKKVYYAHGYAVLDGQRVLKDFGIELIHVEGVDPPDDQPETWVPYPEKNA